jgi:hypothetical protein
MTDSEAAAIRSLQRRVTVWLWFRWVLLAGGIFLTIGGTYWSIEVARNLSELSAGAKDSPGVIVLLSSMNAATLAQLRILTAVGPFFIVWAIGRWRGDPTTTLLLGLAERALNTSSTVA